VKSTIPTIVNYYIRTEFIQSFGTAARGAYRVNTENGWWADRDMMMASGMPNATSRISWGLV